MSVNSSAICRLGFVTGFDFFGRVFLLGDLPTQAVSSAGDSGGLFEVGLGDIVGRAVVVFVHTAEEEYHRDALAGEVVAVGPEVEGIGVKLGGEPLFLGGGARRGSTLNSRRACPTE